MIAPLVTLVFIGALILSVAVTIDSARKALRYRRAIRARLFQIGESGL